MLAFSSRAKAFYMPLYNESIGGYVDYTSIQILPYTRIKLASLKSSERETYDQILNKLMQLVPEGDDEGKYAEDFRIGLLNAKLDLRHGRAISHADLKRKLGLK
jgi:hypothetical protein